MKRRKTFGPMKMTKQVRLLYETALVRGVERPSLLSKYLAVSERQVYRWLHGDKPTPGSEKLIQLGIEKLEREIPEPKMEELESGGQSSEAFWGIPENEDPAVAKDKAFRAKFHPAFHGLQGKSSEAEKRVLAVSWPGFIEVQLLVKKYRIKLPK